MSYQEKGQQQAAMKKNEAGRGKSGERGRGMPEKTVFHREGYMHDEHDYSNAAAPYMQGRGRGSGPPRTERVERNYKGKQNKGFQKHVEVTHKFTQPGHREKWKFEVPREFKASVLELQRSVDIEGTGVFIRENNGTWYLMGGATSLSELSESLHDRINLTIVQRERADISVVQKGGNNTENVTVAMIVPLWSVHRLERDWSGKMERKTGVTVIDFIQRGKSSHAKLVLRGQRLQVYEAIRQLDSRGVESFVIDARTRAKVSHNAFKRDPGTGQLEKYLKCLKESTAKTGFADYVTMGSLICGTTIPNLLTTEDVLAKRQVVESIQDIIRERYKMAVIYMFGSSVTGLAESSSDLDIACDIYNKHQYDVTLPNEVPIVRELGGLFKRRGRFSNLECVPKARCPIIKNESVRKLHHLKVPFNSSFDLSFRLFGTCNSYLLRSYFNNPAHRICGVVVKAWSKVVGINNARYGYLSSYAITLMFIYYLIQEDLTEHRDPDEFMNNELLPTPPPFTEIHNNEQLHNEVGHVASGFFRFYSETFDWQNDVVSIRFKQPVSKADLMWKDDDNGTSARYAIQNYHLAIEDPFELRSEGGLNCCRGLRYKQMLYVRIAIQMVWKSLTETKDFYTLRNFPTVAGYPFNEQESDTEAAGSDTEETSVIPASPMVPPTAVQVIRSTPPTAIHPPSQQPTAPQQGYSDDSEESEEEIHPDAHRLTTE